MMSPSLSVERHHIEFIRDLRSKVLEVSHLIHTGDYVAVLTDHRDTLDLLFSGYDKPISVQISEEGISEAMGKLFKYIIDAIAAFFRKLGEWLGILEKKKSAEVSDAELNKRAQALEGLSKKLDKIYAELRNIDLAECRRRLAVLPKDSKDPVVIIMRQAILTRIRLLTAVSNPKLSSVDITDVPTMKTIWDNSFIVLDAKTFSNILTEITAVFERIELLTKKLPDIKAGKYVPERFDMSHFVYFRQVDNKIEYVPPTKQYTRQVLSRGGWDFITFCNKRKQWNGLHKRMKDVCDEGVNTVIKVNTYSRSTHLTEEVDTIASDAADQLLALLPAYSAALTNNENVNTISIIDLMLTEFTKNL